MEILGWEVGGRRSEEIMGAAGALWKILAPVASGRGGNMFQITILKKKNNDFGE